jgi:hypothetical protein
MSYGFRKQRVAYGGVRKDIGFYVRSKWEANLVRYYRFTKTEFVYEPKEFEFVGLKRGNRFYKPDFYLPKEDRYVEIKGYLDATSITKLKRFRKYFPETADRMTIVVQRVFQSGKLTLSKEAAALVRLGFRLDQLQSYADLERRFGFIPGWER